jgi:excisionase family DNA binding protein
MNRTPFASLLQALCLHMRLGSVMLKIVDRSTPRLRSISEITMRQQPIVSLNSKVLRTSRWTASPNGFIRAPRISLRCWRVAVIHRPGCGNALWTHCNHTGSRIYSSSTRIHRLGERTPMGENASSPRADVTSRSEPPRRRASHLLRTKHPVRREQDRLLHVREAADLLGVSPKTLYQWKYEGRVPAVKLFGAALRFRLSEIEKLIDKFESPARTTA